MKFGAMFFAGLMFLLFTHITGCATSQERDLATTNQKKTQSQCRDGSTLCPGTARFEGVINRGTR